MSKLDELLRFDPLATAEEITGVSYNDESAGKGFDNPSNALGLLLAHQHSDDKRRILLDAGDTTHGDKLPRYCGIIERFGFELVLEDQWKSSWGHGEIYLIYAHRRGLLLSFDSYGGDGVNSATVRYNWKPCVPWSDALDCTSSGRMVSDEAWSGDHDAREALIHNLNKLNNRGEFVSPWVERPFLWLLHYDESKVPGYDYRAITESRVARLPDWVRDFIGPETP